MSRSGERIASSIAIDCEMRRTVAMSGIEASERVDGLFIVISRYGLKLLLHSHHRLERAVVGSAVGAQYQPRSHPPSGKRGWIEHRLESIAHHELIQDLSTGAVVSGRSVDRGN